jgi:hypothetical protein
LYCGGTGREHMRSRGRAKAIGTASIRAASAEPRAVRPAYLIHGHVARVRLCGQHNEGDRDALHDARLDACVDRVKRRLATVFCALSGMKLTVERNHPLIASVDRINSNKGYVKGNVQLVASCVNLAKNKLSQKDFIKLCKSVVDMQC